MTCGPSHSSLTRRVSRSLVRVLVGALCLLALDAPAQTESRTIRWLAGEGGGPTHGFRLYVSFDGVSDAFPIPLWPVPTPDSAGVMSLTLLLPAGSPLYLEMVAYNVDASGVRRESERSNTLALNTPRPDPFASPASVFLDGSGEYLASRAPAPLGVANEWTLSIWLRPQSDALPMAILRYESSLLPSIGLSYHGQLPGKPLEMLAVSEDGSGVKLYLVHDVVRLDEWIHVAATWDGTSLRLFTDGQEAPESSTLRILDGPLQMTDSPRLVSLGRGYGSVYDFHGQIGHHALWSTALEPSEVAQVYALGHADLRQPAATYRSAGSLVHYWLPAADPFEPGADYAGSLDLRNGTVSQSNRVADVPQPKALPLPFGPLCLDLDGETESLADLDAGPIGIENEWTLSAWVKPFSLDRPMALVHINSPLPRTPSNAIRLGLRGDLPGDPYEVFVAGYDGGGKTYRVPDRVAAERWVHLAVRWAASGLVLYVDGQRVPDGQVERVADGELQATDDVPRAVYVGRDWAGRSLLDGRVGHIGLWSRALADAELAEIAWWGNGIDLAFSRGAYVSPDWLVHYWRLGEDRLSLGGDLGLRTDDLGGLRTAYDLLRDAVGISPADDVCLDAPCEGGAEQLCTDFPGLACMCPP